MPSARSSCKDLLGDLKRISTRSSVKELYRIMLGRNLAGSWQEPFHARIYNENAANPELENPRRKLCASLRSRNAHGQVTRAVLCGNLQEKMPPPKSRRRLCASLRSRNAHGHITRAVLCENWQEKPWSSTRLTTYRKNPSVWTHCLGNESKAWFEEATIK